MYDILTGIVERLFSMQNEAYRDFQSSLIPTVDTGSIIGVRTPDLRRFAKELGKREDCAVFLETLPHRYFDENQLHAFILSDERQYERAVEGVSAFLPYIDNWATCDQLSPRVFRRHRDELIGEIRKWTGSGQTYTVRFGLGMLMQHYLDEAFQPQYLDWAAELRSDEYYVNMMLAWYFATALAKQYDNTLPYMEQGRLSPWVHNKTIQKAVESSRVSPEHKDYLKKLKIGRSRSADSPIP